MSEFPVDVAKMAQLGADPGATAGSGKFYTKDSGGVTQSFYQASDGTVYQMTPLTIPSGGVSYQNLTNIMNIGPATLVNNTASLQSLFPAARDTITLAAGNYKLRAELWLNAVDGTTRNVALAFTGSATISGNLICRHFNTGAAGTLLASNNMLTSRVVPSATPQIISTSTGSNTRAIWLEGRLVVSLPGTFVPQFKWSVAGTAATLTLLPHSYLELVPL